MARRPALLLLAAGALAGVSSACSSAPGQASRQPAQPFRLTVTVERGADQDRWNVTYRTNQPVSELVFDRQVNRFRARSWIAKTPGLVVKEIDGRERIASESGSLFETATFELPSYYDSTPKDYEFFLPFSDGSLVMYTGHFNACPKGLECREPVEFDLRGRQRDRVIVLGQVASSKARWLDDTSGRGTYVYFGNIAPLTRKRLTVILDPALPGWLRERFYGILPRIFDLYAKETGFPLPTKPFIFLGYSPKGAGTSDKGGTLPGLIQLFLYGKGWEKENKRAFVHLARFLAHESAHVWNSQLFRCASGDMWMHEGGADAFAYLALYKLGLVDRKGFLALQTEALTHCVLELRNRPLKEVKEDPSFSAHYTCGSMIALITHAAVNRRDRSKGLFQFWQALFSAVRTRNLKAYDEDTYFSTLRDMTGDEELVRQLRGFTNGPIDSSNAFVRSELERLGVRFVSLESALPEEYESKRAMHLVRLLMQEDCGNRYSVTRTDEGIETEPLKDCRLFTRPLLVTKVGPHSIKRGAAAYDFAFETCRREGASLALTVKSEAETLEAETLEAACPRSMPRREAAYGFQSLPF